MDGEKSTLVISKIIVGSPADRCGQLQTGDQLISIDGQKVLGYSCVKVSRLEVCVVAVSYKHFACIGKMSAAKGSISWQCQFNCCVQFSWRLPYRARGCGPKTWRGTRGCGPKTWRGTRGCGPKTWRGTRGCGPKTWRGTRGCGPKTWRGTRGCGPKTWRGTRGCGPKTK